MFFGLTSTTPLNGSRKRVVTYLSAYLYVWSTSTESSLGYLTIPEVRDLVSLGPTKGLEITVLLPICGLLSHLPAVPHVPQDPTLTG